MRTDAEYAALLRLAKKQNATVTFVDGDGMHENLAVFLVGKERAMLVHRDENGRTHSGNEVFTVYSDLSWLSVTIGGDAFAQASSGKGYR